MAIQTVRIGSAEDIVAYDDGDFDSAIETDAPIKAGAPTDANDVLRLGDPAPEAEDLVHEGILTVNGTYQGTIMTVTVDDASAAFGNPLYCANDFHYERTDADSAATMLCVAMALEAGAGSKKVLLEGQICNTAWGWSAGPLYVSCTTGAMTQTAPVGAGDQVQRIGFALSANTIYFRPDSTVIEI